jgi:transcriptional regulator with XRE-family HTH domain
MPDNEGTARGLLAEIRLRGGVSQAELARRAGMTRSVVNAYERGHRQPGVDALSRLAAAGGLRLELGDPPRFDNERAGRLLAQVLDLAEALPSRRRGRLAYPALHRRAA